MCGWGSINKVDEAEQQRKLGVSLRFILGRDGINVKAEL